MTNADFFAERWELEQPAFRKVLQALPGSQLAYRPHERSTRAGSLAWQLAQEQRDLVHLLDTAQAEFKPGPHPDSVDEIIAAWDRATEDLRERLSRRDDESWSRPAKFLVGGQVVWEDTLRNLLWGFLFDMVHHRGQLSTYLRPMGGKVPAIYGPSGDDQGT